SDTGTATRALYSALPSARRGRSGGSEGDGRLAAGRVAIIGGGIAGLAAAYRLRLADTGLALTLVEADTRLGGKIRTERKEGLVRAEEDASDLQLRAHLEG